MEDLISVIVPIYKVEPYLEQCIQSVLAQTYTNLEIILVVKDAGDNCLKISRFYEAQDARVKVLIQQDSGLYAARRLGIHSASGAYVGFVDSDDWIEPEMYEQFHRLMVENDVAVVESGMIVEFPEGNRNRKLPSFQEGCYKGGQFRSEIALKFPCTDDFFHTSVFPTVWNKLFKMEAFAKYQKLDVPSQVIYDDAVCTFPCIWETESIYVSHSMYYHYRYRMDSGIRSIFGDRLSVDYAKNTNMLLCERMAHSDEEPLKKRLQTIMFYNLLVRSPGVFDAPGDEFLLRPFGTIRTTDKIALYGAGSFGLHIKAYLDRREDSPVVCWLDRDYQKKQGGVQAPQAIFNHEYDWVVIAIIDEKTAQAVKKDLTAMGVPAEKICWILPQYLEQPQIPLRMAVLDGERILAE